MNRKVVQMKYSGNNLIDGQHEMLFKMVDEARAHIASRKEFLGLLSLLGRLYHFHDEERIMRENNYPDYENHIRMHRMFIKQLDIYSAELQDKGEVNTKLLDFVESWLTGLVTSMQRQ